MSDDDRALYDWFQRGLELSPEGAALRLADTEVTYGDAHALALRWAGALTAAGRRTPEVVGVLAEKTVTGYIGPLAALYAGAAVVPLNPGFPAGRTRRMLELAGVSALIVDEAGERALSQIFGSGTGVPVLAPHSADELSGGATGGAGGGDDACPRLPADPGHTLPEPCRVRAADVAYVLFTSGSTGRPKGIPISHANLHHYFHHMSRRHDFGPHDVFAQSVDLNWDPALLDIHLAWGAGATLVPVPASAYRNLPRFLTEEGVTIWNSPPSTVSLVRRTAGCAPGTMPTLRWTFFGGEPLRFEDVADWQAAAVNSAIVNVYGPSEATITVADHRWQPEISRKYGTNGAAPIGRLYAGHDGVLLAEDGTFSSQEGELCITGPQITAGYLDPADEQGRFLDHDGRRWYRTGDRVRREENGDLVYLGRVDAQVKVQGVRIELADVDHAVRSCAEVRDAVTVTAPGPNGALQLVVFYTGTSTSPVVLARSLREILPAAMLPRHYAHLDDLPRNSNRKVDHPVLAERAAALLNASAAAR